MSSRRLAATTATALWLSLGLGLLLGSPARGEEVGLAPYAVGDQLPALTLQDQHGHAHTLDAATKIIVFSRDMDAGKVIKAALADGGPALLERSAAAYVSDISAMPSLIRHLFALPALRHRPYTMWLDRDGKVTARFPAASGKASVIYLDQRRITRIEQTASAEKLHRALAAAAAGP
jgi:hypothetical protein